MWLDFLLARKRNHCKTDTLSSGTILKDTLKVKQVSEQSHPGAILRNASIERLFGDVRLFRSRYFSILLSHRHTVLTSGAASSSETVY